MSYLQTSFAKFRASLATHSDENLVLGHTIGQFVMSEYKKGSFVRCVYFCENSADVRCFGCTLKHSACRMHCELQVATCQLLGTDKHAIHYVALTMA